MIISVSMFAYAIAQLVTGVIADIIKPKYMISGGLLFAGLSTLIIPYSKNFWAVTVAYALSHVFLSPIFGAVTKTIASNVVPRHASRVALPVSIATVFGSPLASLIAIIFKWNIVFVISGFSMMTIGALCFILFTVCEKKGWITYPPRTEQAKSPKSKLDIHFLLKHFFIQFVVIAMLVGVNNSIAQLLTSYYKEFLGFSVEQAKSIYAIRGFITAFAPFFFNLFLYERVFKRDAKKTLLCIFTVAALGFGISLFFAERIWTNVLLTAIALLACSGYGAVLLSVYCPSLKRVGAVSSVSSLINCINYITAAVATAITTSVVARIGWDKIVLAWALLMVVGFAVKMTMRSGYLEEAEPEETAAKTE
jgi:ACS family D-galactonate transporter-like MFS transporter